MEGDSVPVRVILVVKNFSNSIQTNNIMARTVYFESYVDFMNRSDVTLNGTDNLEFVDLEDHGNVGCWNCVDCKDCENCADCKNCVDCENCMACVDCGQSSYCSYCYGCTCCDRCHSCTGCHACDRCFNCSYCTYCNSCSYCIELTTSDSMNNVVSVNRMCVV